MKDNSQQKKSSFKKGGFSTLIKKPEKIRVGSFTELEGNLITLAKEGAFDYIGHGCNCFATMGAGIALPIGVEFPEMKRADKYFQAPHAMRLGNYTSAYVKRETIAFTGINFYSQYNPGKDFIKESLIVSLKKFVLQHKEDYPTKRDKLTKMRFGLPLIGCGIAGGNWDEVKEIIKTELSEFDVTIVHFVEDQKTQRSQYLDDWKKDINY